MLKMNGFHHLPIFGDVDMGDMNIAAKCRERGLWPASRYDMIEIAFGFINFLDIPLTSTTLLQFYIFSASHQSFAFIFMFFSCP